MKLCWLPEMHFKDRLKLTFEKIKKTDRPIARLIREKKNMNYQYQEWKRRCNCRSHGDIIRQCADYSLLLCYCALGGQSTFQQSELLVQGDSCCLSSDKNVLFEGQSLQLSEPRILGKGRTFEVISNGVSLVSLLGYTFGTQKHFRAFWLWIFGYRNIVIENSTLKSLP